MKRRSPTSTSLDIKKMRVHRSLKIYEQIKSSSGLPCLTVTEDLTRATHIGVNMQGNRSDRILHFYKDAMFDGSDAVLPIQERINHSSFQRFRPFIERFYPKYGLPKIGLVLEADGQWYYVGFTNFISRLIRNGAHVVGIAQAMDPRVVSGLYIRALSRSDIWMSDKEKCVACGQCVSTCPNNVISLIPYDSAYAVQCNSKDKGKDVMTVCKAGCIGCGLCVKQCEFGAVAVENNIAVIDGTKCRGCGKCAEKCPKKIIMPLQA